MRYKLKVLWRHRDEARGYLSQALKMGQTAPAARPWGRGRTPVAVRGSRRPGLRRPRGSAHSRVRENTPENGRECALLSQKRALAAKKGPCRALASARLGHAGRASRLAGSRYLRRVRICKEFRGLHCFRGRNPHRRETAPAFAQLRGGGNVDPFFRAPENNANLEKPCIFGMPGGTDPRSGADGPAPPGLLRAPRRRRPSPAGHPVAPGELPGAHL